MFSAFFSAWLMSYLARASELWRFWLSRRRSQEWQAAAPPTNPTIRAARPTHNHKYSMKATPDRGPRAVFNRGRDEATSPGVRYSEPLGSELNSHQSRNR